MASIQAELGSKLSKGSSIVNGTSGPPRWSDFGAPRPKYVVNVDVEADVAATINYCNYHNIPFLAQNGGNGWSDTFALGSCGITINIAPLNEIKFNADKTQAYIGGGVRVSSLIAAAYGNDTRVANPTCPCLGFLGTGLGGGLTRMAGLYGWSVDQIISATVVLASGEMVHGVSATYRPDLFWALRGAAPNFGIVTSAVIKAYPTAKEENIAWQGPLVFDESKLDALVSTIANLKLSPRMQVDILLGTTGAPPFTPVITAIPFYLGNETEAIKAFAPLLALGPTVNNATVQPYSQWSDWAIGFCSTGGRKPTFATSTSRLTAPIFHRVWNEYKAFIAKYGASVGYSAILVEHYTVEKAVEIAGTNHDYASYPYRNLSYHTVVIPWYANATFDTEANAWGEKVRDILRIDGRGGYGGNSTYINFAHGDESLVDIYGESLPRLKKLKGQYDPKNRFGQWFPLS